MRILITILCFLVFASPVIAAKPVPKKLAVKKPAPKKPVTQKPSEWKDGVCTVYHDMFDGRRAADGSRFSQRKLTVACRGGGRYGRRVEIAYGKHKVIAVRTDTGRLPLTRPNRKQFDVSRAVALRLGLYSPKLGRKIKYRWLD